MDRSYPMSPFFPAWTNGASPTPTPIRAASNCQKPVARPHAAVITLNAVSDQVMMRARFATSAMRRMFAEVLDAKIEEHSPDANGLGLRFVRLGDHCVKLRQRYGGYDTLLEPQVVDAPGNILETPSQMHQRGNHVGVEHVDHGRRFLRGGLSAASARSSVHPG